MLLDDSRSRTDAFPWAAGRTKGPDVQFNHVWVASRNPDVYTALWNVCATPAFLAKTTDGSTHPEVIELLRYRSLELYGSIPAGERPPTRPDGHETLSWAPMPAPRAVLERELRARLAANPASPAARACRTIGRLFSGWRPDPSI